MKLKLYKEADLELKQFENFEKSELFYEYQTRFYPDRKGSMVPFGLRMLNAELPQYINKPDESISKLYELLNVVQEIINDLVLNQSKESKFFLF
jgi:trafficking protein particle complex subunit 12